MEASNKQESRGMVDISKKSITKRMAVASAKIEMNEPAFKALLSGKGPKGNVLEAAKVAAMMAAKSTSQIIPHCHPLEITHVNIRFKANEQKRTVSVKSEVGCLGRTGVEMEALTAATVAVLTIYDMLKWADQRMVISEVMLLEKTGGRSERFKRQP